MKEITECKKRVREMLRDYGYKKISLSEDRKDTEKSYFEYKGEIHIIVNDNLSFHFGLDKLMGCSAHICCRGTDCCTRHEWAEKLFKKYLLGEVSEDYISKRWVDEM
jgi:hypothetical protein